MILIDLQNKAFDTKDHNMLLLKMPSLGLLGFSPGQTTSDPHFCVNFIAFVNTIRYSDPSFILRYLTSSNPHFCVVFIAVVNTIHYSGPTLAVFFYRISVNPVIAVYQNYSSIIGDTNWIIYSNMKIFEIV